MGNCVGRSVGLLRAVGLFYRLVTVIERTGTTAVVVGSATPAATNRDVAGIESGIGTETSTVIVIASVIGLGRLVRCSSVYRQWRMNGGGGGGAGAVLLTKMHNSVSKLFVCLQDDAARRTGVQWRWIGHSWTGVPNATQWFEAAYRSHS